MYISSCWGQLLNGAQLAYPQAIRAHVL